MWPSSFVLLMLDVYNQVNSSNESKLSCTIPDWEQQVLFTPDKEVPFIRKHPPWETLLGDRLQSAIHCDRSLILNQTSEQQNYTVE